MSRRTVNGRPLTVREAIFLATSRTCMRIAGINSGETMTTDEVREVVRILRASKSRDLNLDTALTEAEHALDFRTRHGY